MAKLKGFYFSLDALLAASVIMGMMLMLIGYQQKQNMQSQELALDQLDTALIQEVSEWNKSKNSSKTVLGYIYYQHFSGNHTEAEKTCTSYFQIEKKYAFYIGDATSITKICGQYQVMAPVDTASRHVIAPDLMINNTFIGPKKAVLVMPD